MLISISIISTISYINIYIYIIVPIRIYENCFLIDKIRGQKGGGKNSPRRRKKKKKKCEGEKHGRGA